NPSAVATSTLSGGSATIQISSLTVGAHTLYAVYAGDVNFAPSASIQVVQVVGAAPRVVSVTPNANIASLAGEQRSRVVSLVVVFDQAVQMDANALTLALHANGVAFNGVAQPAGFGALPAALNVN